MLAPALLRTMCSLSMRRYQLSRSKASKYGLVSGRGCFQNSWQRLQGWSDRFDSAGWRSFNDMAHVDLHRLRMTVVEVGQVLQQYLECGSTSSSSSHQAHIGSMPATQAPTAHSRPWPATTPPALLIAVVDLHPLAWSLLSSLAPAPSSPTPGEKEKAPISPLTLEEFVTNLMVFLNAHLASRWGNEVIVYGATAGKA